MMRVARRFTVPAGIRFSKDGICTGPLKTLGAASMEEELRVATSEQAVKGLQGIMLVGDGGELRVTITRLLQNTATLLVCTHSVRAHDKDINCTALCLTTLSWPQQPGQDHQVVGSRLLDALGDP